MEEGTLLLDNDKSNVLVNCLLSYFLCLSFRTKWLSKGPLISRINKLLKKISEQLLILY